MTSYDNWKLATPDFIDEKVEYPHKEEADAQEAKEIWEYYHEIMQWVNLNGTHAEWVEAHKDMLTAWDDYLLKNSILQDKLNEYKFYKC